MRTALAAAALLAASLLFGCGPGGDDPLTAGAPLASGLSEASNRSARRAYDGAPPVIGHPPMGADCLQCHGSVPLSLPGVGLAPASPHGESGQGGLSRCRQCHLEQSVPDVFVESHFVGLPALRQKRGQRSHPWAPPVMPHPVDLRRNCLACHAGPAARAEIRTTHPERLRCTQCHMSIAARNIFER